MKRAIIPDVEINLDEENDLLKTKDYAETLVKIIKNTPQNKVFTIGLFGSWGSGKSSIIKTAQKILEDKKKSKSKIKCIMYDAWKYTNDSFRRMFLLELQKELKLKQTDEMKRFYESTSEEKKVIQKINKTSIFLLILFSTAILFFGGSKIFNEDLESGSLLSKLIEATPFIASLFSLFVAFFGPLFNKLTVTVDSPILFAPEQFETSFSKMMHKVVGKTKKINKIVLVIDNIDRCLGNTVYTLLSDIKCFLSNEKLDIVFVIPLDDNAISYTLSKDKEEFLRKIFNIMLRIKPHQSTEMFNFTHKLNYYYNLNYNNETLSLIARKLTSNPRRIIQFFNNLSSELCNFKDSAFAIENETLICTILIIREEYNDFYAKILQNTEVLLHYENEKSEEIKSFLNIASHSFKNADANLISRILTNSDSQFASIPDDLKTLINGYSADFLTLLSTEQIANKTEISQYMIKCINDEAKHGAKIQVTNWIDFASEIIMIDTHFFNKNDLIHLDGILSKYYSVVLENTAKIGNLCELLIRFRENNLHGLESVFYKYVNGIDSSKLEKISVDAPIILTKLNSDNDATNLNTFFQNFYKTITIPDITYSDIQVKYFFNEEFIKGEVVSIEQFGMQSHALDNLFLCLKMNLPYRDSLFSAFFKQLILIMPEKNSTHIDKYNSYIFSLLPYLNLIEDRKNINGLINLYDKIFENFNSVSIEINGSTQNISGSITKIDISLGKNEELKSIIDFTFKVYQITNSYSQTLQQQVNFLYANNKAYINSKFLSLVDGKYSLVPFWSIIISKKDYTDIDFFKLIEYCFNEMHEKDEPVLTDQQIRTELASLLSNINNANVNKLVKKLHKEEYFKKLLQVLILQQNSSFFENIPDYLQKLAVEYFSEETKNSCQGKFDYLKIIAEQGTYDQKLILWELIKVYMSPQRNPLNVLPQIVSILHILEMDNVEVKKGIVSALRNSSRYIRGNPSLNKEIEFLIKKFEE